MTDWTSWTPKERATLCFIVVDGRVMLIHKKRGLGAGKINAPGGKIEPGETPLESAIRETQEEILVEPTGVEKRGELFFQFVDGYSLHCHVFRASGLIGEPGETDEALPFWAPVDSIPFHQMWPDDEQWLPQMLAGKYFRGWFDFDGERMLNKRVELVDAEFFANRVIEECPAY